MARGESLEPHPFRARSLRACDPSPLPALLSGEHRPSSTPLSNAPMVRNTPAQRAAKGWVASSHPAPPQPPHHAASPPRSLSHSSYPRHRVQALGGLKVHPHCVHCAPRCSSRHAHLVPLAPPQQPWWTPRPASRPTPRQRALVPPPRPSPSPSSPSRPSRVHLTLTLPPQQSAPDPNPNHHHHLATTTLTLTLTQTLTLALALTTTHTRRHDRRVPTYRTHTTRSRQ